MAMTTIKAKSIEGIIYDALFHIEHLDCPVCEHKVDFYIDNNSKSPACVTCNSSLMVVFEDLKPLRTLTKRSGIKRLKSRVG